MKSGFSYIVRWLIDGQERFLLWRDGGSEPDRYATIPGSTKLIAARTRQQLLKIARRYEIDIHDQEAHVVDLRSMRAVLDRLRPNRQLSDRDARILLEAWNALEDLAQSIGVSFVRAELPRKDVESVYDKLFYGNNLPAVTPEGKQYHPTLSNDERRVLRVLLRTASSELSAEM